MDILLAGDLDAYAQTLCKPLAKDHRITLTGRSHADSGHSAQPKRLAVEPQDPQFIETFRAIGFETVVFFARRGEQSASSQSCSLESLGILLALSAQHGVSRFIYVSSTEVCGQPEGADESALPQPHTGTGILLESGERMCALYSGKAAMDSFVIRIPYLYGEGIKDSLLGRAIEQAQQHKSIELPGRPDQACDFLHAEDLAVLISRIIDHETASDSAVVHAGCGKPMMFSDIGNMLGNRFPGCTVIYSTDSSSVPPPAIGTNARRQYDWAAMRDVLQDLPGILSETEDTHRAKRLFLPGVSKLLKKHNWVLQFAEVGIFFILMQLLIGMAGDSYQFKFVDFRLLFVIIIGTIHGVRAGITAALLACLSVILSYNAIHVDWRSIVYNVNNWLPFISYLLAGIVTGYTREKNDSALASARQSVALQDTHYNFLYDLYNQTLQQKNQYKAQLISYRDSFGRVYDITRRLDSVVPDVIFREAVQILEDTINCPSIAVYSIDPAKSFARLVLCSPNLSAKLERSIAMLDVLQKDQVWVNRQMMEGFPFYCVPLYNGDAMAAMVMAFDVPYEQKSASGANQLLVICRLIQDSLVRAITYNDATEAQNCIAGTHILRHEHFAKLLAVRQEMKKARIAEHLLLRIDDSAANFVALSDRLEQGIRFNDVIGQGRDGSIYLMLTQAQQDTCKPVIDRLASLGIHSSIVDPALPSAASGQNAGVVA